MYRAISVIFSDFGLPPVVSISIMAYISATNIRNLTEIGKTFLSTKT